MPLLRWLRSSVAVSMMFLLLLLHHHHSISILEQWLGGRRAASGRRFSAGLRAMAVSLPRKGTPSPAPWQQHMLLPMLVRRSASVQATCPLINLPFDINVISHFAN